MAASAVAFFTYPFRGQGGVLMLIWTIGIYLLLELFDASRVSFQLHVLTMIPFTVLSVFGFAVFQQYAWATLRHFAAGHTDAMRTIEVYDVLPLVNDLSAMVALLIAGMATLLAWLHSLSPLLAAGAAAAMGCVLPAMLGVMVLEERFLPGLDQVGPEVYRAPRRFVGCRVRAVRGRNVRGLSIVLAAQKIPRAWLLLRHSLDVDPLIRPGSADAVSTLVTAAPEADAQYVDTVLSDFERAYPESERLPEALFEHARWLVRLSGSTDAALELLARVEKEFPQ